MVTRLLLLMAMVATFGCGSQATLLPTDPLTDEQKAAVKAEDAAVADEESQGKLPKPKLKK